MFCPQRFYLIGAGGPWAAMVMEVPQVGLICSHNENTAQATPSFTAGASEDPRSERAEPKAPRLGPQNPDVKASILFSATQFCS